MRRQQPPRGKNNKRMGCKKAAKSQGRDKGRCHKKGRLRGGGKFWKRERGGSAGRAKKAPLISKRK